MPLVQTRGAASAQGFGEFAQATAVNYIEEMFSTYLYTGTGAAQTITNGIDLSTKGGLVWIKDRSNGESHSLWDTARGVSAGLQSNATSAQYSDAISLTAYNSNGFSLGTDANVGWVNRSPDTYVSWTFREQPKFFDVVTYTGNSSTQTIAHNLGSTPGMIVIKKTNNVSNWTVWHRSLAANDTIRLNDTAAAADYGVYITNVNSTGFDVNSASSINNSGDTYVAYLFAHNAGGFGLAGTDNVISCGSFTADGSGGCDVNLGYEPQWIMYKSSTRVVNWTITDNMRGWHPQTTVNPRLPPNTSAAETTSNDQGILSTGFNSLNNFSAGETVIYIAIRRGPMKVPTLGTSVFSPVTYSGDDSNTNRIITTGFPVDSAFFLRREFDNRAVYDRLRGQGARVNTNYANAESEAGTTKAIFSSNTGMLINYDSSSNTNALGATYVLEAFRRAPSFFDEVCYTGTGSNTTQTHNLGVVPELILVKRRDTTGAWDSYSSALANTEYIVVNTTAAKATGTTRWNSTTPTSSVFSVGTSTTTNASAGTYIAYLFATCAGVSKVGSYTGNGTTQTIDCGFGAGGVRFVLIKRTDAAGDWYTYDTARGMTVLTDPYVRLNATGEFATLGSVTTVSTGFALDSAILADINVSSGSYLFLAIA